MHIGGKGMVILFTILMLILLWKVFIASLEISFGLAKFLIALLLFPIVFVVATLLASLFFMLMPIGIVVLIVLILRRA